MEKNIGSSSQINKKVKKLVTKSTDVGIKKKERNKRNQNSLSLKYNQEFKYYHHYLPETLKHMSALNLAVKYINIWLKLQEKIIIPNEDKKDEKITSKCDMYHHNNNNNNTNDANNIINNINNNSNDNDNINNYNYNSKYNNNNATNENNNDNNSNKNNTNNNDNNDININNDNINGKNSINDVTVKCSAFTLLTSLMNRLQFSNDKSNSSKDDFKIKEVRKKKLSELQRFDNEIENKLGYDVKR